MGLAEKGMRRIYREPIHITANEATVAVYPVMAWPAQAHKLIQSRIDSAAFMDRVDVVDELSGFDTPHLLTGFAYRTHAEL